MSPNPLDNIRVYAAACKQERIDRILPTLKNLGIPEWTIEKESPGNPDEYGKVVLDPPSRRFIEQLTVEVERPFMWLEDDADVRPDFRERVAPFLAALPEDWKIAMIGWGLVIGDVECIAVNDHWYQVQNGQDWGVVAGAQCVLVNRGEWRHELAKQSPFRCDAGLARSLKSANIPGQRNGLYLSSTILVGTSDPLTTFGQPVIQHPVYTQPRRFCWKRHKETGNGYSPLGEVKCSQKIKVCQFVYGDFAKPESWFSKYVEPMNRMYCKTHGYEYAVERLETIRPDRGGHWEKPMHIHRNLKDCDYLLYLDADCVFYNHLFSIEDELLHRWEPAHLMMFAADCGGEDMRWIPNHINTGSGLFRNTQETRDILAEWDVASDSPEQPNVRQFDQKGFNSWILPKYKNQIKILQNYYLMNGLHGQYIRHLFHFVNRDVELGRIFHSPMMERNRRLAKDGQP